MPIDCAESIIYTEENQVYQHARVATGIDVDLAVALLNSQHCQRDLGLGPGPGPAPPAAFLSHINGDIGERRGGERAASAADPRENVLYTFQCCQIAPRKNIYTRQK